MPERPVSAREGEGESVNMLVPRPVSLPTALVPPLPSRTLLFHDAVVWTLDHVEEWEWTRKTDEVVFELIDCGKQERLRI